MGKKSTKTTSSSTPWAPAQPILTGAGNQILQTAQNNQGNLNNIEGSLTGTLPGLQTAIGNTGSTLGAGSSYLDSVLGGNYLNSDPYAQGLAQFAGQQAGNAVNSTFSQYGRTGSGNHATDLARGVTQAELQPLMQNYQSERANQQAAAGMMPSYYGAQFAGYPSLTGTAQVAGQLPYYGSQSLGNIGGLYSGYGKQTQTQPGGWGTGLLGAASNMFSFAPIPL